jgi:hypothetical protein
MDGVMTALGGDCTFLTRGSALEKGAFEFANEPPVDAGGWAGDGGCCGAAFAIAANAESTEAASGGFAAVGGAESIETLGLQYRMKSYQW